MDYRLALCAFVALGAVLTGQVQAQSLPTEDWPAYGRTLGGDRHAPLSDVTPQNAASLTLAWSFATGEGGIPVPEGRERRFEATPLVIDGVMYLSTPLGRVFALNATTGVRKWMFDAKVDPTAKFGDFGNRGVAYWRGAADAGTCAERIFLGALDARLIAIDAKTGLACETFGQQGQLDLRKGLRNPPFEFEEYELTSPPTVVGNVVVVGSAVADNNRTDAASGEVRGFDARTGALLWSWDPVTQDRDDPAYKTWQGEKAHRTGGANVWSVISADPELGLVYLPTTSPSPDYYGGERKGANQYANALVALHVTTGKVAWSFQAVHHDLWDYDNAAPPALIALDQGGKSVPAVVQATKTGQVFVLDRRTGKPLFPVEERPVPASDVPGEEAWPTQPFNAVLPQLSPNRLTAADIEAADVPDKAACLARLAELRNDGPFTPPSLRGSLLLPSNIGGVQWGGVSFDAAQGLLIVPTNRLAAIAQLVPQTGWNDAKTQEGQRTGLETTRMRGTPYVMRRELFFGPNGRPCTPAPYGELVAVDLHKGKVAWRTPLGTQSWAPDRQLGGTIFGGPMTTAGGLTFIGAARDGLFRALETSSGKVLWSYKLPDRARANPMTYRAADGRQMIAIAAGRGASGGEDQVYVFALPKLGADPSTLRP